MKKFYLIIILISFFVSLSIAILIFPNNELNKSLPLIKQLSNNNVLTTSVYDNQNQLLFEFKDTLTGTLKDSSVIQKRQKEAQKKFEIYLESNSPIKQFDLQMNAIYKDNKLTIRIIIAILIMWALLISIYRYVVYGKLF